MGIGDWGLGIGDWGLGQSPNPQSPLYFFFFIYLKDKIKYNNYFIIKLSANKDYSYLNER